MNYELFSWGVVTILGSKKRKRSRANQGSHSGTSRSAQNDTYEKYAKYAGAVSNKSKRNYADLRLVRPDNLKEYASENARPRTGQPQNRPAGSQPKRPTQTRNGAGGRKQQSGGSRSGRQKAAAQSAPSKPRPNAGGQPKRQSAPKKPQPPQATAHRGKAAGGFGEAVSSLGAWVGSITAGAAQNIGGKSQQGKPPRRNTAEKPVKSASAGRAPRNPAYIEDEYSKALNNADFYGDILGKYSMKYPEKQTEHKAPVASSAHTKPQKARRRIKNTLNGMPPEGSAPKTPQKSIAELAVKNRGTAGKRKYAKVVKNGKAKGSVPLGSVHRKVHRRNRRRSMFIGAAAVSSAALVMLSVFFFAFFKVKKIEVAGETPYSDSRITELCAFAKGDNLMFIDTAGSEQQVLDSLPYIESCKIKRTIPNVVEVNVTCANELGVAEIGNGFWSIISTGGKILENVTNVAVVSSSDIANAASSRPDIHSVEELAAAKELPVLEGLEFKNGKVGEYVTGSSSGSINGFNEILKQGEAFGMQFDKLKYTARGYEAEYDNRLNIVLGDRTDDDILKRRIEVAHFIICVKGYITEHDKGEITFLKNQTFFNPTYDISEEELAQYADESELDQLAKFAQALLDRGVDLLDEPEEKTEKREEETSQPEDTLGRDIADHAHDEPQET